MLLLFVVLIAFQYFYPGPLLLYITLVLIILEILAMIDLYFVKKTLQIDQQFDVMTIHQGDSMNIQYFAKSKLIYPILELKIDVINLQTGNTYSIEPPKISYDEGFVRLNYRFNEAGTIRFTLKEVRCKDFLHIAHFKKKMNLTFKLNVYPSPARITRNDVETQEVLNDGETSDQKGLDYAEIFGFHDYVYGEDIRHIHHKLSAKYDKWIMKEGSYTSKPIYIYHLKKNYFFTQLVEDLARIYQLFIIMQERNSYFIIEKEGEFIEIHQHFELYHVFDELYKGFENEKYQ